MPRRTWSPRTSSTVTTISWPIMMLWLARRVSTSTGSPLRGWRPSAAAAKHTRARVGALVNALRSDRRHVTWRRGASAGDRERRAHAVAGAWKHDLRSLVREPIHDDWAQEVQRRV